MQPQAQRTVVRVHRIEGSIVLYRSPKRSLYNAEKPTPRADHWLNPVLAASLFIRTVLRLVFVCPHLHKGPPITLRKPFPGSQLGSGPASGRRTYITCLDCGQQFTFDHKTRRLADFWGTHDSEALARARWRVVRLFSPIRRLVARHGRTDINFLVAGMIKPVKRDEKPKEDVVGVVERSLSTFPARHHPSFDKGMTSALARSLPREILWDGAPR